MNPIVIYEDNHLLIVNKPAGWLVQGDKTGDVTLTDWGRAYIKKKYDKPGDVFLHPAHRLDRPVSGLVIFCRTSKSLERMTKAFRDDAIQKTYLALVEGRPNNLQGELIHWLWKDRNKNLVKAYQQPKGDAKKSVLNYESIASQKESSLLRIQPKTGRSHQIRVQLSKMHCPIIGDVKYGASSPLPDKQIALHAFQLNFTHPVKKIDMQLTCAPESKEWSKYKAKIDELDRKA